VTSQSGHNETLFVDPADYQNYISLIDTYKKQYGFKLFSYTLMPTHLHLLIELRHNIAISTIMHDLNSLYTKNFNTRYGKKGHLFQERFKAVLTEKEPYLLPLTRYIHLHPKREKIVEDPKDYSYSSHQQFLDSEKRGYPDLREEAEEIFTLLNGREKAFEDYVTKADAKEIKDVGKLLHRKRILGSKAFTGQMEKAIEEAVEEQRKAQLPNRAPIVYIVLSGAAILILAVTLVYSSRYRAALKSEYDKTLAVYDRTLDMLKDERDKAIKANKDAEEYMWKIRLTEKALDDLKRERMEINGYSWRIDMSQVGGPRAASVETDTIVFEDNRVVSSNLSQRGFTASNYSTSVAANDNIVWETIQRNERGETANWRGEWDGSVMKGALRTKSAGGRARDFSFKSTGERIKR
jgi:REP element-mobilizing transposase RayT